MTNRLTDIQIQVAAKMLEKVSEATPYTPLATALIKYCQQYINEQPGTSKQSLMQEELRQIESEIRIKKQNLQKFLENAYADEG